MSSEPLFEEVGKRLGKQPDEVRNTLGGAVEILNCIVEMRESSRFAGDGVSVLITVGIGGVARILEQLAQQGKREEEKKNAGVYEE